MGRRSRIAGRWALRVVVALAGALIAVAPLRPHLRADRAVRHHPGVPAGRRRRAGRRPPLGALAVDVYDGPLRLDIGLQRVDQERARRWPVTRCGWPGSSTRSATTCAAPSSGSPGPRRGSPSAAPASPRWSCYRRRWREPLLAAGITTVLLSGTAGIGAATWRPEALSQPKYTGLLVNANSLIGSAEDIVARFDAYRASLEDLVKNVGSLYATLSALPAPGGTTDTVALLHVSDLHLNPAGFDLVRQVVDQFEVDAVLDTGDITDWGSAPENQLITSVGTFGVPTSTSGATTTPRPRRRSSPPSPEPPSSTTRR